MTRADCKRRIVVIKGLLVSVVKDFRVDIRFFLGSLGGVTAFDVLCWPGTGGERRDMGFSQGGGCWKRATTRSVDRVLNAGGRGARRGASAGTGTRA